MAMREPARPKLKQLAAEASKALARLDADRLEEFALACQALHRDLMLRLPVEREMLAGEARDAAGDMATLARVLEATRANLQVMNRLRALRTGSFQYAEWGIAEGRRGHD